MAVHAADVTALVVDQVSFPGGTVADHLRLPFATVCNALLLDPDPAVPPYFTCSFKYPVSEIASILRARGFETNGTPFPDGCPIP